MSDTKSREANIPGPTDEEIAVINTMLHRIGGQHVSWGASSTLDVWLAETRLEAERIASRRLLVATWVLAAATVALVLATIGLIVVGV